jgi:hypothetical protein
MPTSDITAVAFIGGVRYTARIQQFQLYADVAVGGGGEHFHAKVHSPEVLTLMLAVARGAQTPWMTEDTADVLCQVAAVLALDEPSVNERWCSTGISPPEPRRITPTGRNETHLAAVRPHGWRGPLPPAG